MTKLRFLVLLGLIGTLFAVAGPSAAADSTELSILKARIDFGKKAGTDRLELKATFDPDALAAGQTPMDSALEVTVGPDSVISLPAVDPRGKWRVKKDRIYRYRVKATRKHRDSLELRINVEAGKLNLVAERIDLRDVRGLGAEEVSFSLTVAGATFTKTLEMGVRDQRWRYRYTGLGQGIGGGLPGGGGTGGGDTGGGGDAVSFRTLHQSSFPSMTSFQTVVLRTQSAYSTEWFRRYPPPPPGVGAPVVSPPTVDFSREIVVLIDLGTRPTGGYTVAVTKAEANGTGLRISWRETRPGANCVVTTAIMNPFVFAAVTRRDGTVTFSGSTVTKNCP